MSKKRALTKGVNEAQVCETNCCGTSWTRWLLAAIIIVLLWAWPGEIWARIVATVAAVILGVWKV